MSETLERAEELASTIIEAATAQINSLPSALPGAEAVDAFQSRIDKRTADCLRTVAATRNHIAH